MTIDLRITALGTAYLSRTHTLTVRQVIDEVLARIAAAGDDRVWISRFPDQVLRAQADALDARRGEKSLPLYGIPFGVKDNIDVEGLPTTAACPGYAYRPQKSADVVRRLINAGAIPIGKTNLDQFATGLVGVRSPYGVPRNPFDPDYIPGGSSSGSAVAVSSGLVSFALGTDTAGSGRVPAGFNNIVGWKPTPGLLSNEGVVPACASLDCVSVFALSCVDAEWIHHALTAKRPRATYAKGFRFGVPKPLEFFGDEAYAKLYEQAMRKLLEMGGWPVEFDYAPFAEAAKLLYAGPWVAERTAAVGAFIEKADAEAGVWPTTRDIILGGRKYSAVDAFEGQYKLKRLIEQAERTMGDLDFLALPTAGTIYTVADLAREPVRYNSNLGHYTNFVNFFGLSALALPFGFRPDGLPFGITLIGHPGADAQLLDFGAHWQRTVRLPLGKTSRVLPEARVSIAVVGAHMSGLPLNGQLTERNGRLESATRTAAHYRLYALPGGPPQRPGLVRVAEDGAAIELEVWSLSADRVGDFVAQIPSPLGFGTIELADGSTVQGFLCESYATAGAPDISRFGGWRAWLASQR